MRFTVRRPPNGEVSPCGHRPSGGDVACGVDVGVAPTGSADFALEDRLALAVPGSDVPARGATLRRIRGRDLLDPTVSLVLQTRDELTPATSADRTVEPTLLGHSRARLRDGAARGAGHRPHIKGLDSYHVEPAREHGARLLDPVFAPVPVAGLQLRDRPFRFLAAVGASHTAGEALLQHLQPLRLTPERLGTCSSSPVDSAADTATPRSMPTTLQSPGPQIGSGMRANATCQRPARSRVTR